MQIKKLIIQTIPKMPSLLDFNQDYSKALSTLVASSVKLKVALYSISFDAERRFLSVSSALFSKLKMTWCL